MGEETKDRAALGVGADVTAALRVGLVAAVVAVEVAAAGSSRQRTVTTVGLTWAAIYVTFVLLVAWLLRPLLGKWSGKKGAGISGSWRGEIARVNGIAALVVIPLVYFVSRSTSVYIRSTRQVIGYPWLPLWLTVALFGGALAWRLHGSLAVRSRSDLRRFEAVTLVWFVGPAAIWMARAGLPGALGRFAGFDDAQYLAAPRLIFHAGAFPWKDLFFIHGLLGDVFDGAIGQVVFASDRWGTQAGLQVLVLPLMWVIMYLFVAYFARGRPIIALTFAACLVLGIVSLSNDRFWPLPILLILLDLVLRHATWGRCIALMAALVIESIVTPETGLMAIGILATVVIYDVVHGTGWRPNRSQFAADCTLLGCRRSTDRPVGGVPCITGGHRCLHPLLPDFRTRPCPGRRHPDQVVPPP